MKHVLRAAVGVAMLVGLAFSPASPAQAVGASAGTLEGTGWFSPGWSMTPTNQYYAFNSSEAGPAVSGTTPLLSMSCATDLHSILPEDTVQGIGYGQEHCSGSSATAPWGSVDKTCSVSYSRLGLHMELTGSCTTAATASDGSKTTSVTYESSHIDMVPTSINPWAFFDALGTFTSEGV